VKRLLLALLFVAAVPLGCSNEFPEVSKPKTAEYLEPTSPENVVSNLIEAYRHKEAGPYAQILAPEFTFKLQPKDADKFGMDALPRNLDLAATQGIFTSRLVSGIDLILTHTDAVAAGGEFPAGVMTVRVNPTFLAVSRFGGVWTVEGDIEDLYFRPGDAGAGENPDHWLLIEWRDIPNPSSSAPGTVARADDPVPVIGTTWGQIKMEFLPTAGPGF
jgi:hypothetical protein